jgi:multicomponent Na+:H+ antiporter subunit B
MKYFKYMIFQTITKFILPYIVLFAFYIQINGEASPGGGFQAGALIASSCIAYSMMKAKEIIKINQLLICASFGLLLYLVTGLISLLYGYNYLNYYYLSKDRHLAQFIGIFIIELGVAITVSSVMLLIYYVFNQEDNNN